MVLAVMRVRAPAYYTTPGSPDRGQTPVRSSLPQNSRDTATLHEAAGDLHTLLGEYSAALQAYESDVAHAHLARSLALSAATGPSPRVAALNR